jgi:hypothetical protein
MDFRKLIELIRAATAVAMLTSSGDLSGLRFSDCHRPDPGSDIRFPAIGLRPAPC